MSNMKQKEAVAELYRLIEALGNVPQSTYRARAEQAETLRLAARRLDRINERECNGVIGPDGYAKWDDADQAKADKERERAEKRAVAALVEALGDTIARVTIDFQGDPRGASIVANIDGHRVAAWW